MPTDEASAARTIGNDGLKWNNPSAEPSLSLILWTASSHSLFHLYLAVFCSKPFNGAQRSDKFDMNLP